MEHCSLSGESRVSGHSPIESNSTSPAAKPDIAAVPNPFASPQPLDSPEAGDPLVSNSGFVARTVFGLWAGVLFGGTFGAGGSVMLSLTNGAVLGVAKLSFTLEPVEALVQVGIVSAVAGAISGLFAGGIIGPMVSVMSYVGQQNRRSVIYSSVVLSSVAGSAIGYLGSQIISGRMNSFGWEAGVIGIFIGSISGVIGGFQLARSIISFAKGEIS